MPVALPVSASVASARSLDMDTLLSKPKFTQAFVTHVSATKTKVEVWCQTDVRKCALVTSAIDDNHMVLSDLFAIISQKLRPKAAAEPQVGKNYLTRTKNDLHFHRVVVTHTDIQSSKALVLLIDYGPEEWVPFSHLVEMDSLFELEPLAQKYYLADVRPSDGEWNLEEVKRCLEPYLYNRFNCEVIGVSMNTECIRVYDDELEQPLVTSLVKHCNGILQYPSCPKEVFEAIDLTTRGKDSALKVPKQEAVVEHKHSSTATDYVPPENDNKSESLDISMSPQNDIKAEDLSLAKKTVPVSNGFAESDNPQDIGGHEAKRVDANNITVPKGMAKPEENDSIIDIICDYCGKEGHYRNCKEAHLAQQRSARTPVCYNCKQEGHVKQQCPEPRPSGRTCYSCQAPDHLSRDCPTRRSGSVGGSPTIKCYNCQREGHVSRNCPDSLNESKASSFDELDWAGDHCQTETTQSEVNDGQKLSTPTMTTPMEDRENQKNIKMTEIIIAKESVAKIEESFNKADQNVVKAVESAVNIEESVVKIEESVLKTEESGLKTEESSLKTEESGLKTEESSLKTEESVLKTEESGLKTEESSLKTEESGLKPEESGLKPEESIIKPEKNVVKPEESVVKPEKNVVKPKESVLKPKESVLKPEESVVKPEESVVKPEESVVKPEESVVKPEKNVVKPEESVVKPEKNVVKPEESVLKPEESVVKPEESIIKPEKNVVEMEESSQREDKASDGLLGQTISVFLSSYTTKEMFLQRASSFNGITEMTEQMVEFYDKIHSTAEHRLESVKVGDLVAARYSLDKLWYRASVTGIDGQRLKVFYLDYGNTENVETKDCKALTDEFRQVLEPQAIRCVNNGKAIDGKSLEGYALDLNEIVVHFTALEDEVYKIDVIEVK